MDNRKAYLQKEEEKFINNVVKAIINRDVSKTHYLIDDRGLMRYVSYAVVENNSIIDLKYENGTTVKVVCVFGPELIETIHFKGGNDELTKPWVRRAVRSVIDHGKQLAEDVYMNSNHS